MSHTKGPWLFSFNSASTDDVHCINVDPVEVSDTMPSHIAYLQSYTTHDYDDRAETIANARLITAAPELLDALIELVKQHKTSAWPKATRRQTVKRLTRPTRPSKRPPSHEP